jgi:hypothetical protein
VHDNINFTHTIEHCDLETGQKTRLEPAVLYFDTRGYLRPEHKRNLHVPRYNYADLFISLQLFVYIHTYIYIL